ncbi:hypothetical protein R5R35_003130 [Gryllus longicercus]|uniref:Uncharacterized protein n=1 Tax=Gryllus longicercus TaxID=2509291 RepID=A0AAN9Z6H3_9ORTH
MDYIHSVRIKSSKRLHFLQSIRRLGITGEGYKTANEYCNMRFKAIQVFTFGHKNRRLMNVSKGYRL